MGGAVAVVSRAPTIGVMVSGNAMAHLYLEAESRTRPDFGRHAQLLQDLLKRPSIDLMLTARDGRVTVSSAARGRATTWLDERGYHYERGSGDPLGIGKNLDGVSSDAAYDATIDTDYPDGVVQIVHLATAPRAGEVILSAARDWDFRARYEPIPHLSSHGALHREHMMVPLLVNRVPRHTPRRTVDVMPSALAALGKAIPPGLDGRSFL